MKGDGSDIEMSTLEAWICGIMLILLVTGFTIILGFILYMTSGG